MSELLFNLCYVEITNYIYIYIKVEISDHAIYTNLMSRRADMIYAKVVKQ